MITTEVKIISHYHHMKAFWQQNKIFCKLSQIAMYSCKLQLLQVLLQHICILVLTSRHCTSMFVAVDSIKEYNIQKYTLSPLVFVA